jgi:Calcineurin-like phosphoesterase
MCQPLTRRQFLRYSGLVAATPLFARAPARRFAQVAATAVPMNLELVTLTESSAVLTWFTGDPLSPDQYGRPAPVPADTVLLLGTSPLAMRPVVERDDETPYHYVELTGLSPSTTYFYRAVSNGLAATPTQGYPEVPATGSFTTWAPLPGRHLFTMGWCNDLHLGELTSGLAYSNSSLPGGGFPPGYPVDPDNPYWRVMARATVAEAKARGAELLLLNGDLTSEAEPVHMAEVRATFDAFGPYRQAYWVTRGNHDRAHSGPTWSGCRPVPGHPGYDDCLLDAFFPDGRTFFGFDHHGVHFVGLDTTDTVSGQGSFPPGQAEWLRAELAAHSGVPTFVFGHHPVSEQARVLAVQSPGFMLDEQSALRLEQALATAPSLVGVYNGHTHRNNRTSSPLVPNVPFVELGAVKEYPGGYGLVRVHEGGYAVNFYKTKADPARAWSERSRGEYLGLYPYYTLGRLADRNFVVAADLSDAARPAPAAPSTAGPSSPLPATGGTGPALGLAAAGAGIALRRAARSADSE